MWARSPVLRDMLADETFDVADGARLVQLSGQLAAASPEMLHAALSGREAMVDWVLQQRCWASAAERVADAELFLLASHSNIEDACKALAADVAVKVEEGFLRRFGFAPSGGADLMQLQAGALEIQATVAHIGGRPAAA